MEKMSAPRAVHCHFPFSSQENVTLPDPTTTPSLKQCPAVFEEYEELRGFSFSYQFYEDMLAFLKNKCIKRQKEERERKKYKRKMISIANDQQTRHKFGWCFFPAREPPSLHSLQEWEQEGTVESHLPFAGLWQCYDVLNKGNCGDFVF